MSNTADQDIFAQIGAQRVTFQAGLIEPEPEPCPDTLLPLKSDVDEAVDFRPVHRSETAAELREELRALRDAFTPFLADLGPELPCPRASLELDTFQWRRETVDDQARFATVLDGGGDWETVQIPHYGGPLGRAVTYYRTSFALSAQMRSAERLFICFKGVDYQAHVFVNGSFIGSHQGFFAPFEFDITSHVREGENILVVKVENDAICMSNDSWSDEKGIEGDKIYAATGPGYDDPEVGWHHCPPGMGIYQGVRLEARAALFISDIFVRPVPEENRAEVWIDIWNCGLRRQPVRLTLSVYGQNFEATVCDDREFKLPGPTGPRLNYYRFNLELPEHRVWELNTPWLYQVQARLLKEDGSLLDAASRQFGMRSFRMDVEGEPKGRMYLNGREIRLRGANTMGFEQQDVMRRDWDQLIDDILLAKLCNMNFWRLTQRPVQSEVYDYCDRLGLLTQTDLPLFGKMRRNQFSEGVRQAGEMERLVRSHPCNIMVSYINEPFPSAWRLELWRYLEHAELESFFLACDQAVRLENPDRVIKAVDGDYDPPSPGLPDMHCYCGWYNGHGLDLGKLHRGHWQRVKPGWMFGCGEFGAEGLEDADLMRRCYPAGWLPQSAEEEATWSPARIVKAQSGNFHYMWFDTQHRLEDWIAVSQAHQAWVTRIMTEAFRRESRMNTFAIHLFIDAFPAGWMKTIMDCERRPKPAYFVYRDALTPLMVNLRSDRFAFFAGETAELEAWICNDTQESASGARLAYRLEVAGQTTAGGWTSAVMPVCASQCQGRLRFELPQVDRRTTATVRLALLGADGEVLHDTSLELGLFPRPQSENAIGSSVFVLGSPDGAATRLARDLGCDVRSWTPGQADAVTILVDDLEAAQSHLDALQAAAESGATVVVLAVPSGEHSLLGDTIVARPCGMNPVHFVSRATGHPLVAEFAPNDFKFWHDAAAGRPAPLLKSTFTADGWTPVLTSGNGGWGSAWAPALAVAEKAVGKGCWRLCQVELAGRVATNPVACLFARRLIGGQ